MPSLSAVRAAIVSAPRRAYGAPASVPEVFVPLLAAAVVAILGACSKPTPEQVADGDDPLAALAVSADSHRYTESYWAEQYRADSAGRSSPWKQALAYCGTNDAPRPGLNADGNKPNCFAVFQVEQRTPPATARYQARQKAASERLQRAFDSTLREAQARARRF